jgi:putative ABC transport system substrate-binding protein
MTDIGRGQFRARSRRTAAQQFSFRIRRTAASFDHVVGDGHDTLAQAHPAALLIGSDPYLFGVRKQQIELAAHQSIPTMFSGRAAASDGGLMSYGINFADGYRQAATYVARVLKGAPLG